MTPDVAGACAVFYNICAIPGAQLQVFLLCAAVETDMSTCSLQ